MNKLREKFDEELGLDCLSEKCEQITDDFSVKFSEWLRVNYYDNGASWTEWNSDDNTFTTTEILQIFKEKYYE